MSLNVNNLGSKVRGFFQKRPTETRLQPDSGTSQSSADKVSLDGSPRTRRMADAAMAVATAVPGVMGLIAVKSMIAASAPIIATAAVGAAGAGLIAFGLSKLADAIDGPREPIAQNPSTPAVEHRSRDDLQSFLISGPREKPSTT